jgi:MFS family permease
VVAIAPVFGVSIGMSQDQAAALLVALQGGSLLMQWPLGWLSDHIDRRYVIAGLAAGTGLISILIIWATATPPSIVILCFGLWGGLALCVYPVCVAHASDLVEPGQIVVTVSNLLISWAVGMMIGPLLGAFIMDLVGPGGLFMYSAAVSLSFAAFVALRIAKRSRPTSGGGFVDIAPTSPATAALSPRAEAEPEQVKA